MCDRYVGQPVLCFRPGRISLPSIVLYISIPTKCPLTQKVREKFTEKSMSMNDVELESSVFDQ
jgi:hypothetical protein